jgi:serine/threonine protein kinase
MRDSIMKSSVSQDVAQYSMQESVSKKLIAQKESRQKKGRSLSNHVGSRWYRAPEVSLCDTQYDIASDMWGIGCIIFELLRCCEDKHKELPDNKKYQDRVIFPGSSCFPLSPCEKTRKTLDS